MSINQQRDNMEYLLIAAVVIGLILIASKKKKDKKPLAVPLPVVETVPVIEPIPTGRYITINDLTGSVETRVSQGDPDGHPDMQVQMCYAVHKHELPICIGVTSTGSAVHVEPMQSIMNVSGLGVPIVAGNPSLDAHTQNGDSPLSRLIAKESKRGALAIMCGGLLTDVAHSLKYNGAVGSNITLYETPNTHNQKVGRGASEYCHARVKRVVSTPSKLLFQHLGKKGGNIKFLGKTPSKFIDDLRDNKAWNMANNPAVLQHIKELNTFMSEFQSNHPVRWADFMHNGDYFGIDPANAEQHYKIIVRGATLMKKYQN